MCELSIILQNWHILIDIHLFVKTICSTNKVMDLNIIIISHHHSFQIFNNPGAREPCNIMSHFIQFRNDWNLTHSFHWHALSNRLLYIFFSPHAPIVSTRLNRLNVKNLCLLKWMINVNIHSIKGLGNSFFIVQNLNFKWSKKLSDEIWSLWWTWQKRNLAKAEFV